MKPLREGRHALEGRVLELPTGEHAAVESVQHSFENGTTVRLLSGRRSGHVTQIDTFRALGYKIVDWPNAECGSGRRWRPAASLPLPRTWPRLQGLVDAIARRLR